MLTSFVQVVNLSIENPKLFSDIIFNLWHQTNGQEGEIIVMDGAREVAIGKQVSFITNPFSINCNDKKIMAALYKEMNQLVVDNFYEQYCRTNSIVVGFIDELINKVPYYLTFEPDMKVGDLLKIYDVRISTDNESIVTIMIDYMRALKDICGISIFIVLSLKQYMTIEQLKDIYEFCFYHKIYLINIEGHFTRKVWGERCVIIDETLCVIES